MFGAEYFSESANCQGNITNAGAVVAASKLGE